jgi:N-methylhydantoinase B
MLNTYDRKAWQDHDCVIMTGNSDGEKFNALGLMGGTAGKLHTLGILRDGKEAGLRCVDVQYVRPGDLIWSDAGGGGGVGSPLDREVEKVRWDVLNEYISIERAREVYGVVIAPGTLEVDREATAKLRSEMRAK